MSSRSVRKGAPAALAASLFVASAIGLSAARAQDPPLPGFAYRYGRVAAAPGVDLQPATGHVVAFVRGRGCGEGITLAAPPGSGEDTGHTVYTVQAESDAIDPGCGIPGEPITLWFPTARRMADALGPWFSGSARMDAIAARDMPYGSVLPSVASD